MQIKELIALASIRAGKTQQQLGLEMGHKTRTRISKIGAGVLAADASEIVYLATQAKEPPIKVLAEIESERHPELAKVWKEVAAKGTWLNTSLVTWVRSLSTFLKPATA